MHYRWSALAQISPFLEQTNLYNSLNFDWPVDSGPVGVMGEPPYTFFPANLTARRMVVGLFLCPSDNKSGPDPDSGPTNYAFCSGGWTARYFASGRRPASTPQPQQTGSAPSA